MIFNRKSPGDIRGLLLWIIPRFGVAATKPEKQSSRSGLRRPYPPGGSDVLFSLSLFVVSTAASQRHWHKNNNHPTLHSALGSLTFAGHRY